jgi:hypothetical protein
MLSSKQVEFPDDIEMVADCAQDLKQAKRTDLLLSESFIPVLNHI